MALASEFLRQHPYALTCPAKGRFRISASGGIHEPVQVPAEARILVDGSFSSRTFPPNPGLRRQRLTRYLLQTQLFHPFGDRPARHACRPRNYGNASISNRRTLRSRHQAPHSLVQKGRQRMKSQPNALVIHYPRVLNKIALTCSNYFLTNPKIPLTQWFWTAYLMTTDK